MLRWIYASVKFIVGGEIPTTDWVLSQFEIPQNAFIPSLGGEIPTIDWVLSQLEIPRSSFIPSLRI